MKQILDLDLVPVLVLVWVLQPHDVAEHRRDSERVAAQTRDIVVQLVDGVVLGLALILYRVRLAEGLTFLTFWPRPRNSCMALATDGFSATMRAIGMISKF